MPHHRATLLPILLSPLLSAPAHAASHSSAALHAIQQPSATFLSRPIRLFSQCPNTQLYSILNAQCPAPFSTLNNHPTPTPAHARANSNSTMSSTPESNTKNNPTQSQNSSTTTSSSDSTPPNVNSDEYLALPDASSSAASGTTKLDISEGGSTVKLDHMGPLVVNQDGSLSRIANWDQMAEIEKKNTLRVLGKRNKARLEALKKAGGEGN